MHFLGQAFIESATLTTGVLLQCLGKDELHLVLVEALPKRPGLQDLGRVLLMYTGGHLARAGSGRGLHGNVAIFWNACLEGQLGLAGRGSS